MVKTNAIRLLDKQKIAYRLYEYEWNEDKHHSPLLQHSELSKRVYKTILVIGKSQCIYVCLIPIWQNIDFKKVAHLTQEKSVSLLPLDDLEKKTGYIRGGCSPIGMKKQYTTFIDKSVNTSDTLIISGGKRGVQIELSRQALLRLTQAKIESLVD
ncbi:MULTISPECIES: Cys-tRNA(Pro) deacylase [unclassified Granulicatella]|uniref:Cys-tRNA(Pro) deacylase n=1 Tax=unclassified Granulicatella TaxID=2630493 RepID=UPI0010743D88|nr:Cys-tRNA(Pro) deacylase [Granulicatella sp. WM01]MBF0781108.1 Cys-tRNA(Pro) deacylase [Granulicatella sp. 19428wC4_WM01]TFU92028.1 Cys-tRNA(Pro) deacylase [Granulicatella sp. WM01]